MSKVVYRVMVIAGAACIVAAVVLFAYNHIDEFLAGRRSDKLIEHLRISEPDVLPPVAEEVYSLDETETAIFTPGQATVTAVTYNGLEFNVIGFLDIPKLNIMLPVIDRVSDELLKLSVCWYDGQKRPEPVRMILTAHNYRAHFGRINRLKMGDEVIFRADNGTVYSYRVTGIEEINGDDQEGLDRGDWDLTLLTCTRDRVRRILVRCVFK